VSTHEIIVQLFIEEKLHRIAFTWLEMF